MVGCCVNCAVLMGGPVVREAIPYKLLFSLWSDLAPNSSTGGRLADIHSSFCKRACLLCRKGLKRKKLI